MFSDHFFISAVFFLTGMRLIYSVVLLSIVPQSEPVGCAFIYVYVRVCALFLYDLLQDFLFLFIFIVTQMIYNVR